MPIDPRLNQFVARRIRETEGIEMTPDQVDATRRSAYAKIREAVRAAGCPMPEDDGEMLEFMVQLRREGREMTDAEKLSRAMAGEFVGDAATLGPVLVAEIRRLRGIIDVITGPPLTQEEAEAALDNLPELDDAEKEAAGRIDIDKIIAYATNPDNASPEEMVRQMVKEAERVPWFNALVLDRAKSWLEKRFA
jgi:hypothetical protein